MEHCANGPALQAEAAPADANLLQPRQRPALCKALRQPRRHYAPQPVVTTRELPQPTKTYGGWRK